eukprot:jgi/Tetstr1/463155/TSEL_008089.t1
MKRFTLREKLYDGRFSVVHKARDNATNNDVVIKRCRDHPQARREYRAVAELTALKCRNIAALEVQRLVGDDEIYADKTAHNFYNQAYDHPSNLVFPVYGEKPRVCYTDLQARDVIRNVLRGLNDIHGNGYIHRDVKRENILYDGSEHRLVDFGLTIRERDAKQSTKIAGTPFYLAPEIVQYSWYTSMVDMYATGVVLLYSILHEGGHPIAAINDVKTAKAVQKLVAESSYDPARWENERAPLAADLCWTLLQKYPGARVTVGEALQHPLFMWE